MLCGLCLNIVLLINMQKIFIGSTNPGKIKEFTDAFNTLKLEISDPNQLKINAKIEETGITFEENALIKARQWAKLSNLPTLVDDSGLCIDYLGGKPGIFSARFVKGNDQDRNNKILELLKDIPLPQRTAHYICVIAFVDPISKIEITTQGICKGIILDQAQGDKGFGYDPIFQPLGYKQSFGQLPMEVKQKISHRAKALAKMAVFLKNR